MMATKESSEEVLQLNLSVKRKTPDAVQSEPDLGEEASPKKKIKTKTKPSEHNTDKAGEEEKKEYISSLFNHNPEIPKVELSGASSQATETVFSEKSLADGGVHPYIAQTLTNLGMKSLTQVQSLSIPVVNAGFDAFIKSQTGSGKTLAYAIPMMQKLAAIRPKVTRQDGTLALVICPTRELVLQSYEWFLKLCHSFSWIVPGVLIGGEKRKSEKARIRKGVTVLIATPGRLVDHIAHTKSLSLKKVQWLVLDECDRSLELGYKRDVQVVLNALNSQAEGKRQTLLISATLTRGIEEMSEMSLRHPKFIDAAVDERPENQADQALKTLTVPDQLQQTYCIVPAKLRLVVLASFILWKCRFSRARKLVVFLSTQDMVDYHCELFDRCLNKDEEDAGATQTKRKPHELLEMLDDEPPGTKENERKPSSRPKPLKLLKLHGSMEQDQRVKILDEIKSSEECILFCTDVAARGLDLPHVDWIVQYNCPINTEDYVHRVGRTARIGAKGSSLLFLLPSEANFAKELENNNMVNMAELTVDRVLEKLFKNKSGTSQMRGRGKPSATMEEEATRLQMEFENLIVADSRMHEAASQAYTSFVRSYASYPVAIRNIFNFKELHLGHIAKSFALRDPPSKITGIGKGHWVRKEAKKKDDLRKEQRVIKAQMKRIDQKSLVMSEFSSGLDSVELNQSSKVKPSTKKRKMKK